MRPFRLCKIYSAGCDARKWNALRSLHSVEVFEKLKIALCVVCQLERTEASSKVSYLCTSYPIILQPDTTLDPRQRFPNNEI